MADFIREAQQAPYDNDESSVGRGDLASYMKTSSSNMEVTSAAEHHGTGKRTLPALQMVPPLPAHPMSLRSAEFHKNVSVMEQVDSSHTEIAPQFLLRTAPFGPVPLLHGPTSTTHTSLPDMASVQSNIAFCTDELDEPSGVDLTDAVISHDMIARKLEQERERIAKSRSCQPADGSSINTRYFTNAVDTRREKHSLTGVWRRFTASFRRSGTHQ